MINIKEVYTSHADRIEVLGLINDKLRIKLVRYPPIESSLLYTWQVHEYPLYDTFEEFKEYIRCINMVIARTAYIGETEFDPANLMKD